MARKGTSRCDATHAIRALSFPSIRPSGSLTVTPNAYEHVQPEVAHPAAGQGIRSMRDQTYAELADVHGFMLAAAAR